MKGLMTQIGFFLALLSGLGLIAESPAQARTMRRPNTATEQVSNGSREGPVPGGWREAEGPAPDGWRPTSKRITLKFRGDFASRVERLLPTETLRLARPIRDPQVQEFFKKFGITTLRPVHAGLVRLKKETGQSEAEIVQGIKNRFPQRARRSRGDAPFPELTRTYVLEMSEALSPESFARALDALKSEPFVEWAHPDGLAKAEFSPNDPAWLTQGTCAFGVDDLYGLKKISSETAWDISAGAGVVVAVTDTGVFYGHEDIAANIWSSAGEIPGNGLDDDANGYVDDVRGWDFVNLDNDPVDDHWHGTHVAGTIAAVGNNSTGVIGVAFRSKVMPVKVLASDGYGWWSDVAAGAEYACRAGADIVNASLGGGYDQGMWDAVRFCYGLGVVYVAAAMNNNRDVVEDNSYPCLTQGAICVASSDWNDEKSGFSNFGYKIDVAAPGSSIYSLGASNIGFPSYFCASGTSMATPHVAGLAALILSRRPDFSSDQVQQVMRKSADDLGAAGFDTTFGYGRINARRAMDWSRALEATITDPYNGYQLPAGPSNVRGKACGPDFLRYRLEVGAGEYPSVWNLIQESTTSVCGKGADGRYGLLGAFDPSSLAEGATVIRLTATDAYNETFVDRIKVKGPTTPPTVEIVNPRQDDWLCCATTVSGTASDNTGVEKVEVQIDSGVWNLAAGTASWSWVWDPPANEYVAHTVTARATDLAGTTNTSSLTVVVDSRPLSIGGLTAGSVTSSSAVITWSTNKGTAGPWPADSQVRYGATESTDQSTPVDATRVYDHSVSLSALASGALYYYRAISVDEAGNRAESGPEAFMTVSVPPAAPAAARVRMNQNPPGTADTVEGLSGAVQANATVKVFADGLLTTLIVSATAGSDGGFGPLSVGDNRYGAIYITATDAAGNAGGVTVKTNDITAPANPTLAAADETSGSPSYTNSRAVTVSITNDGDVTNWCLSESKATAPVPADPCFASERPSRFVLSAGDGAKTLYLWVMDSAKNMNPGPAVSVTITLDTTPPANPTLALSDPTPASELYTNQTLVNAAITDDGTPTGWCLAEWQSTPPSEASPCFASPRPSTYNLSISQGDKEVFLWVRDAAGNINAGTVSAWIILDTAAPLAPVADLIQVYQNPPGTPDYVQGLPGAVEANTTVRVYGDQALTVLVGQEQALGDGSFPPINIGDDYFARVGITATDAAGNESPATEKSTGLSS